MVLISVDIIWFDPVGNEYSIFVDLLVFIVSGRRLLWQLNRWIGSASASC